MTIKRAKEQQGHHVTICTIKNCIVNNIFPLKKKKKISKFCHYLGLHVQEDSGGCLDDKIPCSSSHSLSLILKLQS